MALEITNRIDTLELCDEDNGEMVIYIWNNSMDAGIYINHQDAIKIIEHLKEQFEL